MNHETPGQAEARHDEKVWIEQNAPHPSEGEHALREKVARLNEDIAAREAGIEALVSQMQEGDRKARGSSKLIELNKRLQTEAQAQKIALLEEVENLKRERAKIEAELTDL